MDKEFIVIVCWFVEVEVYCIQQIVEGEKVKQVFLVQVEVEKICKIGEVEVVVIEVMGKVEVEWMKFKVEVYQKYGDVVKMVLVLEVLFQIVVKIVVLFIKVDEIVVFSGDNSKVILEVN